MISFVKTLIVIVNFRTPDLVVNCINSISLEIKERKDVRVVVIDNFSQDDSEEIISNSIEKNDYSNWCEFRALKKNGGFAWGNNQAIGSYLNKSNPPEYIWLLNPDTLVLPDALINLENILNTYPDIGIVGSRIENADGSIRSSAFRFHSSLGELENALSIGFVSSILRNHIVAPKPQNEFMETDWVSGASMMVRKEVFDYIGLLDEEYFLYFEETDFCLRASRSGFKTYYVPESRIIHFVGKSTAVTGEQAVYKRRPKYWFDSRKLFFTKNYGRMTFHLANLFWIFANPLGSIYKYVRKKENSNPPYLWLDFVYYYYLDNFYRKFRIKV